MIDFDGNNDIIRVPSHSDLNFSTAMTVSLWFILGAKVQNWEKMIAKAISGGGDPWSLYEIGLDNGSNNNRKIRFGISEGSVGSYDNVWTTTKPQQGTLHHVVGTWDDTYLKIYIDGEEDGSSTPSFGTIGSNSVAVGIGSSYDGSSAYNECNCQLEDVRLYNRVLSSDEIRTIYACRGVDGIVYGLAARWLLNEGKEDLAVPSDSGYVKDVGSGAHNGTRYGGPIYKASQLRYRRRV